MKKLFIHLILVCLVLFLIGCSETTVNPPSSSGYSISGHIENWYYGTGRVICFAHRYDSSTTTISLDTSDIDNNGNFQLNFASIPDSMLTLFSVNDSFCTEHVVVNPPNSKYCDLDLKAFQDSIILGNVVRSNDTIAFPHPGKCYASYYYFDRATSVHGTDTCNYYGNVIIAEYNISINARLNTVYILYNEWTQYFIRATVSTSMPVAVNWYLERYNSNANSGRNFRNFRIMH